MARPETCTLGYNSLRFDDEFVRYGLFRNFYDAYEREWRGGNSRWDLLDVLRLAHALRPEGIAVAASARMAARRFKPRTPRRRQRRARRRCARGAVRRARADRPGAQAARRRSRGCGTTRCACATSAIVAQLLDPVAHAAGAARLAALSRPAAMCSAPVLPLARHPQIDSRVIVFDLDQDPDALLRLSPEDIADRLYTPAADLPEGESRVALKEIHLNRCPVAGAVGRTCAKPTSRAWASTAPTQRSARASACATPGPALAEKVRRVYAADACARAGRCRCRRCTTASSATATSAGSPPCARCRRTLLGDARRSASRPAPAANCCSATARATGRRRLTPTSASAGTTTAASACARSRPVRIQPSTAYFAEIAALRAAHAGRWREARAARRRCEALGPAARRRDCA